MGRSGLLDMILELALEKGDGMNGRIAWTGEEIRVFIGMFLMIKEKNNESTFMIKTALQ